MGLSCSYEIAKAMGGEVRLISSVSGNTVFEIKLPVNVDQICSIKNDLNISIDDS
jgi:signal transduction histidine kinase